METPQYSGFASEAGHFYDRFGNPAYDVPNKATRKKCDDCGGSLRGAEAKAKTLACSRCDDEGYVYPDTRPATLSDAKKLDLGRGVTTIIRAMAAPGLERWKQQQLLEAIYTAPMAELAGLEYGPWSEKVQGWATEHAKRAAAVGTAIHATIEHGLQGRDLAGYEHRAHFEAFVRACSEEFGHMPEFVAEKSFSCSHGYGCKIDAHVNAGKYRIVLDIKTKDFKGTVPVLETEHAMQLAGNSKAACVLDDPETIHAIAFVDRANPVCRIVRADRPAVDRGWKMFWHCLQLTRLRDGWAPSWATDN